MVILGLCAAAWPWKPISWCSRQTVIVLTLLPEAVWNSVASVATEDRRFLRTSALRSCFGCLCGLPLRSWAVAAPRCFHFTTIALTVDRGSSSRAEICRTDLLEKWHPMTVPHWKSLSSSVRPFYCQCLSMEFAWLCAHFYTPVNNGCGWNSESHSFEGMSTYLSIYGVYTVCRWFHTLYVTTQASELTGILNKELQSVSEWVINNKLVLN